MFVVQNKTLTHMPEHNYNKYGKDFLEPFNEPVTFKLLGIKPDPNNKGGFLMPMFKNVPATSRVTVEKNGVKEVIELALIKYVHPSGEVEFDSQLLQFGQFNNGEIHLTPEKPQDFRMFNFLNHCHFNRDSKYTYEGANHIFYRVDPEGEAKKEIKGRAVLRKAILMAAALEDAKDIKTVYSVVGNGNPSKLSISEMKNEIEELSMTDPQLLVDTIAEYIEPDMDSGDDGVITTQGLVSQALASKALIPKYPQLKFERADGAVFFTFKKKDDSGGKTGSEQLADALNSDPELKSALEVLLSNVQEPSTDNESSTE